MGRMNPIVIILIDFYDFYFFQKIENFHDVNLQFVLQVTGLMLVN